MRAVLAGGAAACNLSLQRTLHLEELVRACAHMCERGAPHQTRIRAASERDPYRQPLVGTTPSGEP